MAFEFARGRAAEILGIHPKHLSLVGSARMGYSLAPKKFGLAFDIQQSDIDLFAISSELFAMIVDEYHQFMKAWANGQIQPKHDVQRMFWESSRDHDPFNISRGFLDSKHIPTFDLFPVTQRINNAAYKFHVNLQAKAGKKVGKRASIRVYKDWDSAVRQIARTLRDALEQRNIVVIP